MNDLIQDFLAEHAKEIEILLIREITDNGIIEEVNGKVTWSDKVKIRLQERADWNNSLVQKLSKRIEDLENAIDCCIETKRNPADEFQKEAASINHITYRVKMEELQRLRDEIDDSN